ncbi:MCE family protein [Mycobacterium palustre]|uniref:Mammalian cell entry protein n=1 Tax=Mycobacterium palustre TaxID=153971 RepID=A0A1X1ZIS1_9MYCO|nr:MlaD family protein [Mycobacterium palustre]MCV7102723.1 MCE family protein [Mycobacterium palustre]ORW23226.1 mammalian cell entry protein [Mycobacterium palustre]
MKQFSERNPYLIGGTGIVVLTVAILVATNYQKFTFLTGEKEYAAYFAEAGGLETNSVVEVSGARVGRVSSITLDGPRVLVKFTVPGDVRLGDRTEASVKTKTLLGSKLIELTPRGEGRLDKPIPLERTTPAYQLPDALGDLSTTVSKLDTDQLSSALSVLANEFSGTGPQLKAAADGVARFSQTLTERDKELRKLLSNANKVTKVLAERSDEVVNLVGETNSLLAELKAQNRYLDKVLDDDASLVRALAAVIDDNHATLKPALDKLNGVVALLNNRKGRIQEALKGLDSFALALGEAVASGPFFKAYIVNLLPGQFIQPFIDSAFSDLGLDPATKLPSQLTDPQTGQPGTPPLPMPYPRTGQGGEPRLHVPDAITGNPGDQPCSVPGRPGAPGCYPLRPEPPAPPPGGPPPGPPAPGPGPGNASSGPVEEPAPGQIPPGRSPVVAPDESFGPRPGPPSPPPGGQQ